MPYYKIFFSISQNKKLARIAVCQDNSLSQQIFIHLCYKRINKLFRGSVTLYQKA
jgi:hypothetical protein